MPFSTDFKSSFTEKEKASEMIRQVAAIGDSVEIALVEDVMAWMEQRLDMTKMTETSYRSLLTFFLTEVRAWFGSTGQMNIYIDESEGQVNIPVGKTILAVDGTVFRNLNSVDLYQGQYGVLNLKQGQLITIEGTYNSYISLSLTNIDLSTIVLKINGSVIQRVQSNESKVVRPTNGFFPFYYEGTLFIKIYAGASIPVYEGQSYEMTYYQVDGYAGNIAENELTGFSDTLYDSLGREVKYHVTNESFTDGLDLPKKYELLDMLRYWYYTKDSVSKVSDYVNWFRLQPEVGDVFATGDYEEFLRTGNLQVTGKVRVALLSKDMGEVDASAISRLEAKLGLVRDVGLTVYKNPVPVYFIVLVRFRSASDVEAFKALARSAVSSYYDLATVRSAGNSLFDDVSTTEIMTKFSSSYSPVGLELLFSFYKEVRIKTGDGRAHFYFYQDYVKESSTTYRFVYVIGTTTYTLLLKESSSYTSIVEIIDQTDKVVGTHNYKTGLVEIKSDSRFIYGGILYVTGPLKQQGTLSAGTLYGYRVLKDVGYELY